MPDGGASGRRRATSGECVNVLSERTVREISHKIVNSFTDIVAVSFRSHRESAQPDVTRFIIVQPCLLQQGGSSLRAGKSAAHERPMQQISMVASARGTGAILALDDGAIDIVSLQNK